MRNQTFKILLIDDDDEMNIILSSILSGYRTEVEGFEIKYSIDYLKIDVYKVELGQWQFSDKTITSLRNASNHSYDLIMADYGLVDDEAKDILWGLDRKREPTREEAKGRILTLKNLSDQYRTVYGDNSPNLFNDSKFVFLRSFASKLAFDIVGPVIPNRLEVTKSAFPNAVIEAFDPRNEIYGGDTFYKFYDQENGRDFYRQIVGFHSRNVVEKFALRQILNKSSRIRVRRSIFNIAMFAGWVAIIGGSSQYLSLIGISEIQNGNKIGYGWIGLGLLILIGGTIFLAFRFEKFSRKVINYVKTEFD